MAGLNEVESLRVFKEVRQGHKGMGSADRVVDRGFFLRRPLKVERKRARATAAGG